MGRSSLINAPRLIDAHPRIASKTKEALYRLNSRNLFSFLLAWLTMTCELHLVQASTVGHLRALSVPGDRA